MPKENKDLQLPADASLIAESFVLNPDGTVTVKNSELNEVLTRKLKDAVADANVNAVNVGITVGT